MGLPGEGPRVRESSPSSPVLRSHQEQGSQRETREGGGEKHIHGEEKRNVGRNETGKLCILGRTCQVSLKDRVTEQNGILDLLHNGQGGPSAPLHPKSGPVYLFPATWTPF
ncbi:UNVERIFIED_CONTAM: hypothetical protein K2H54_033221 [Gekko kuhli]